MALAYVRAMIRVFVLVLDVPSLTTDVLQISGEVG